MAATVCGWYLVPSARSVLTGVLAAHAGMLVWGVADLRCQFFVRALWRGSRTTGAVALTFDDGPDPLLTPLILDTLHDHGIRATFFVVAQRAARYPDIVKRSFAQGHTIGCHDLHHSVWSNFRTARTLYRDIADACATIRGIIGSTPLLYRPPVGCTNPHTQAVLDRLGMHCIGWSRSAAECGNRIRHRLCRIATLAEAGEVVLLHDALPRLELREEIVAQIDALCVSIERRRLKSVGVEEMFGIKAYG